MHQTVAATIDLYKGVHQQLRDVVEGLDADELNWSPGAEMNSVAVLVTHTLGSELDTLQFVRDIRGKRDRDAEFQVTSANAGELLSAIDRADAVLDEYGAAITDEELFSTRTRPGREPQSGLHWLLSNYGHAREHLGHILLTRQLYQQRV